MSSADPEQDSVALNDNEQELSKEERLEAARKKYEELKKKKKKSKKSKKGANKDTETVENEDNEKITVNDTNTEDESKNLEAADLENEPEDGNKDEKTTSESDIKEKDDMDKNEENGKTSDVFKHETKDALKEKVVEDETSGSVKEEKLTDEKPDKDSHEKKKDATDKSNKLDEKDYFDDKKVAANEITSADEDTRAKKEEAVKEQEKTAKDKTGSTATFKDDDDINALKSTIEQQKSTIKKLRDENTDLKLSRMDLQDKITELEAQLKSGFLGESRTQQSGPSPHKLAIKPAKPVFTKNDYASVSQQNFSSFSNTDDFREKLMVWKGWQVDMRLWNASNNSQKISL